MTAPSPAPRPAAGDVLRVTDRLTIPRAELQVRASRAGGPGGQHVNTASTRIELLWNVRATAVLSDDEKARVLGRLAARINSQGVLRVVASARRSQRQNREAAEDRLIALVAGALARGKRRVATMPSPAARRARLEEKRRHATKKRERQARDED